MGEGSPARLANFSTSAQSSSPWFSFASFLSLSDVTAVLCSNPAVCSGAPASPFGAGGEPLPRVVSWFGFLNFALLFHSVSLSLTSSGFFRRPRVSGFYGSEPLAGPWLCDPSAVRGQVEVAASGRPQQWSVPWWLCSAFGAQCSVVFACVVAPYVPSRVAVVLVDLAASNGSSCLLPLFTCVLSWFVLRSVIPSVSGVWICWTMAVCLLDVGCVQSPRGLVCVWSYFCMSLHRVLVRLAVSSDIAIPLGVGHPGTPKSWTSAIASERCAANGKRFHNSGNA